MSVESQERILKFDSEEPEAAAGTGASEERADVDAFDVAAQRLIDELETLRRAIDEAQTDAFDAEARLAKVEKELAAERKRVAELENELNAANEKNAGLVNLADALRQERDLALRTSDERRRAIARRDEELLETRRQRDDFERIAREARRENWLWRVVGFVSGAACFGASWIF